MSKSTQAKALASFMAGFQLVPGSETLQKVWNVLAPWVEGFDAEKDPARRLLNGAFVRALASLMQDNQALLQSPQNFDHILEHFKTKLQKAPLADRAWYEDPESWAFLAEFQGHLADFLKVCGVKSPQNEALSQTFPRHFLAGFDDEWKSNPALYEPLKPGTSPLTPKRELNNAWQKYWQALRTEFEQPIFDETFGLNKIYIWPRAYYTEQIESDKKSKTDPIARREEKKIGVWLENELKDWWESQGDWQNVRKKIRLRVLSGGPGSGKSSFALAWAVKLADAETRVLRIPLHRFDLGADIWESVDKFAEGQGFPPHFLKLTAPKPLLLIFDGLDELAKAGKVSAEIAKNFVTDLNAKLDSSNRDPIRVLLSGRELVVQAQDWTQPRQVLHLLPYLIMGKHQYQAPQEFLEFDQRQEWWQLYGQARVKNYAGLPQDLARSEIQELTLEPLLNYLLALSYEAGELNFQTLQNRNQIYADLLKGVHRRESKDKITSRTPLNAEKFSQVLEEIAVAVWHGDGRTATLEQIEKRCQQTLSDSLQKLVKAHQDGVLKLMLAFYFREAGWHTEQDEHAFEFTHKSFGEYLAARKIVKLLRLAHDEWQRNRKNGDGGWTTREAQKRLAALLGPKAMDQDLYQFIRDEVALEELKLVKEWQTMLCRWVEAVLAAGLPMEQLGLNTYHEMRQQARNTEEALLALLSASAWATQELSQIHWENDKQFGTWLRQLVGQGGQYLTLDVLNHLDLTGANLWGINFSGSRFWGTNFLNTNLREANLKAADLSVTNLSGANLRGANLFGTNLFGTKLLYTDLSGTNLRGADLSGADFSGANLKDVVVSADTRPQERVEELAKQFKLRWYDAKTDEIVPYAEKDKRRG